VQRLYRVLLLSAAVQLGIASLPDTMGDLFVYRSWTRTLAEHGIMTAYWPSSTAPEDAFVVPPIDYPPVLPYLLLCVGRCLRALDPALLHAHDRLLDFAIRLPFVLANLAIALMVYAVLRRRGDPRTALWAAALFAFNAAVVFDTAYWGQADSLCVVFLVASLVMLERGRAACAWALIVVAALVKPLAWPFVPLVGLASLKRFGPGRTLRSSLAAATVVLVILLPFFLAGRLVPIVKTLFLQIDAMPYTSVNAHNFWWIASGGHPWKPAAESWLGGPSYETVGLLLFGAVYLLCARELWRSGDS
jgi:dolichyl-phosphate-mannose-protein mannosyltransferase